MTRSINANIDGTYTAVTSKFAKANDLTINLAALDSDMKLNYINADGRVILFAGSALKNQIAYDILNASKDSSKANIEGYGISVLATGDIGKIDNKITFNATKSNVNNIDMNTLTNKPIADTYGVDMKSEKGSISIKGLSDAYDTHVCNLLANNGSIYAEFSGNTYIENVSAKENVNLVTRGTEMYIENIGTLDNVIAENINIKVLDINDRTRVNHTDLNGYDGYADSILVVKNMNTNKNSKITFTGDNVYAGGYHFHMGKDRDENGNSYWTYDDRTSMTEPYSEIRVNAVRPNDVSEIGKDIHDRNYYDGGSIQDGKVPGYVDEGDDHIICLLYTSPSPRDA